MPIYMMPKPADDYELIRRTSDDSLEQGDPDRVQRLEEIPVSLRPPKKKHRALFFTSLILLGCSSILTIHRLLDPQSLSASIHRDVMLGTLWPVGLPNRTDLWENENSKALHALVSCLSSDSCGENQKSIVLLSSHRFAQAIRGGVAGEEIWAISVRTALQQMGYTTVFTNNNEQLAAMYRQFPDLVKVIFLEGDKSQQCFKDTRCIKTKNHPLGIPAWKMLSFYFWSGSANPLGNAWTLSPENYPLIYPEDSVENVYMGYSIEDACAQTPYTPFRERPRQVYILAKKLDYFGFGFTWPQIQFDKPPFEVAFLAGIREGSKINNTLPSGISDLGLLNRTTFYRHVSESRILLGVGQPKISPSPYDALCMGVPFLNPIESWDRRDPENRTKWKTQHEALKYLDPPYIYNVQRTDESGFWNAIRLAMDTPIERYIVPNMTMDALKIRVRDIVEDDWRGKAERLLDIRKTTGKGELFEI